jgi:SagB-type dehydrogenase family enzyme
MRRIDLASPIPREVELPYSEFSYQVEEKSYLHHPTPLPDTSLPDVLVSRQSRRTFKTVPQQHLNSLLWHAGRAITVNSPKDPRWQHRPTPSAGGKHPIDLLIFPEPHTSQEAYLYDPVPHALAKLKVTNRLSLEQFLITTNQVVALEQATIIWFGAQFERTLSKYKDGESLVWRDAGALITTISLVAESLDLNCCAIGITGEPFISHMLDSKETVIGVGGLLLGQR